MKNIALIVAGGNGSRIGESTPKQYLKISGQPILRKSIEAFLNHPKIDGVKVVISKGHEDHYAEATEGLNLLAHSYGGDERQESVLNGLLELKSLSPENILVHDAARPFINSKIINSVVTLLEEYDAVDVGVKPKDTIKTISDKTQTLNRDTLYCTQTPQGFKFKTILQLHEKYKGASLTDDITMAIKDNLPVGYAEGSYDNIKITTKEDLQMTSISKVGLGFDVHKFDLENEGEHAVPICGVKAPNKHKVIAHSDGDVGLHALMDAMLGTASLGDIGVHFPPSDDKWKDADSCDLLEHVNKLIKEKGGTIQNIDITIICERPKLMDLKDDMKKKLAEILKIAENLINVKATTTEKLGFTGRGEGIAAQAVCSITY